MIVIGFGNKCRQGKDTAVSGILDYYTGLRENLLKHGIKSVAPIVQRIGFADELYQVCKTEYGMTEKDAPLLQRIGAERRVEDPEYWIKRAFAKVDTATDIVLISDVRYQNEAEFIKDQGGYVVNVRRINCGMPYVATDRPSDHPSEIDLDKWPFDFYLANSEGHQALLSQQAITLTEYLIGLHEEKFKRKGD
jgi:hypothetical protein